MQLPFKKLRKKFTPQGRSSITIGAILIREKGLWRAHKTHHLQHLQPGISRTLRHVFFKHFRYAIPQADHQDFCSQGHHQYGFTTPFGSRSALGPFTDASSHGSGPGAEGGDEAVLVVILGAEVLVVGLGDGVAEVLEEDIA